MKDAKKKLSFKRIGDKVYYFLNKKRTVVHISEAIVKVTYS